MGGAWSKEFLLCTKCRYCSGTKANADSVHSRAKSSVVDKEDVLDDKIRTLAVLFIPRAITDVAAYWKGVFHPRFTMRRVFMR
jgi:hypothetical protein